MTEYLFVFFFLVALIYSSAGLGGGSSYLALMLLFNFPPEEVVVLALLLNIVVTFIGTNVFTATKQLNVKELRWYLLGSVPAAFLGGVFSIPKEHLKMALGAVLIFSAIWMLLTSFDLMLRPLTVEKNNVRRILAGGVIGLLAGLVGIGGGIFLAPLLILFRWEEGSRGAALTSAFILINSFSGLLGHWSKGALSPSFLDHQLLFWAVIAGALLGPLLSARKLSPVFLKRNTGFIVLFAGLRLVFGF